MAVHVDASYPQLANQKSALNAQTAVRDSRDEPTTRAGQLGLRHGTTGRPDRIARPPVYEGWLMLGVELVGFCGGRQ